MTVPRNAAIRVETRLQDAKTFKYKPNWPRVQARWDAFWARDEVDRPCMAVTAPRPDKQTVALPEVRCIEDKWMNPDYLLAKSVQRLDENYLLGEAVPSAGHLMACSTLGCGDHPEFHEGGILNEWNMAPYRGVWARHSRYFPTQVI